MGVGGVGLGAWGLGIGIEIGGFEIRNSRSEMGVEHVKNSGRRLGSESLL